MRVLKQRAIRLRAIQDSFIPFAPWWRGLTVWLRAGI